MSFKIKMSALATILAVAGLCTSASAAPITNGFTFAVASSCDTSAGNHYHSNTGGSFGNPAGKAEVGRYSCEEVRGLSEYNLTGLATASSAFVTFTVFKAGGLFPGTNDFPFTGNIGVQGYAGNNLENISDYQAASLGTVGDFSTVGLGVGDVLSFDITSIFNSAISASQNSLGMRLFADPLNARGAWTFDNFRLTTTSECTTPGGCGGNNVPEPGSLALIGLALAGLAATRRKQA
jgi:hypothetical protein